MACCGRGNDIKYVMGVCSVCVEVDFDSSVKKVFYCVLCNAYICTNHQGQYLARAKAATSIAYKNLKSKFIKI